MAFVKNIFVGRKVMKLIMKKNKKNKSLDNLPLTKSAVQAYSSEELQKTDPFGYYTGVTNDKNDRPVQDHDDL